MTRPEKITGLVVFSVVVFIFSFATAASWVNLSERAIRWQLGPKTPLHVHSIRVNIAFSSVLTLTTMGLAVGYAFATQKDDHISIDSTLLPVARNAAAAAEDHHKPKVP